MATKKIEKTKKSFIRDNYTKAENDKAIEILVTARIGLLLRQPFFGNMATRLELEDASTWCGTIATDGRKFYYNIGFVMTLNSKEAEFGFGHEVYHNVFDHAGRRGYRDLKLSNIAADYAVNQLCKDDKIGTFPRSIQVYQDDKYRGWAYEAIYDDLCKNAKQIDYDLIGEMLDEHLDGEGDTGDSSDGEGENSKSSRPTLTEEEKKQIRDEIREAMISAANSAGAGKTPASIARMIGDFTEPKMDWREMLRMNIQSIIKSNYSFSRPNRKSQQCGAILPGMMTDETVDVSIAIDMSGSITDKQAKDFMSEIKGIMDEYVDFTLDLWCFDVKVYNYAQFTSDTANDIFDYKVKGGGGTNFTANFTYMKEHNIEPKRFIMFTDGYPNGSWGDENYCETLFIIHGNDTIKAPYGQTAWYK